MSKNEISYKFGEVAVEEGIISRKTFKKYRSRHRELSKEQDPFPTFKSFLIRTQNLSEDDVHRIEQKMRQDPEHLDLSGYEIERKLGKGTTGTVYKATQLRLDRPVAIKLLHPSLADDDSYVDRFYQEIRTVGNLKHSGIVQGIDVGEENGLVYFIMEYVEGDSLGTIIKEEGRISEERAVDVGYEMATALAHAADKGLIHRDVKPDNIMFDDSGSAKLCDLGLAREAQDTNHPGSEESEVVGTPNYMSPEQASGNDLDIRTDLYSLGATLYHAVTGSPPFHGDDVETVMKKHVSEDLDPPKQRRSELSPQFNAVIEKLMAKDRKERYQSPQQAAEDFECLQNHENLVHASFQSPGGNKRSTRRRHRNNSWMSSSTLAGLLVLAVLTGVTLIVYNSSQSSSGAQNPGSVSETGDNQQKDDSNPTISQNNNTENGSAQNSTPDTAGSENTAQNSSPDQNQLQQDDTSGSFERIKQLASGVEGSVPRVNEIVSKLTTLREQAEDDDLQGRINQFMESFLNRQSEIYLRKQTALKSGANLNDASIKTLVRIRWVLEKPPKVFENTSFISGTNDPKKNVEELIKKRTREKNRRLVGRIEHNLPEHLAGILNKYKFTDYQNDSDGSEGEALASGDKETLNENGSTSNSDEEAPSEGGQAKLANQELPLEKQSEQAELNGASVHSDASGYRGEGYVSFEQTNRPGEIIWNIQLPGGAPSSVRLGFRYSLDRDNPCPMTVIVNGNEVASGSINPTGGPDNWQTFAVQTNLKKGENTVILRTEDPNGPHVDLLKIIPLENLEGDAKQTVSDQKDRPSYEGPLEFNDVEVGELAFAINLGGSSAKNGGIPFDGDPFDSGNDVPTGSKEQVSGDIKPAKFQSLYSHVRVGKQLKFTFPLANGTYDVRLYFIESWYEQIDGRVFHVLLQDQPVLTNFDIYKTVNEKKHGLTKTFQNVPVTKERLTLLLKGRMKAGIADDAIIAGIAIKRTGKP